jgi:hypothetical protein
MQKHSVLFSVVLLLRQHSSFSQTTDSITRTFHFKGAVTVTNKGISLIATFTLGKPAVTFDLSMGRKRLFFEPQLRFALEGKPWSFLFWWRYKLIANNTVAITVGAHPAMNFKTEIHSLNGVSKKYIVARRYLAGELVTNYLISKNVSAGFYYLYSRGFDYGSPKNTHFLTINTNLASIKLSNQIFARFTPQLYYFKDGFYFTSTLALVKRNFPVTVQSIINKTIQSDVPGSQNFIWNVSLIYIFNKPYVQD